MRREALATCERGLGCGEAVLPTTTIRPKDAGDGEIVSRYSLKFQAERLGMCEGVTPNRANPPGSSMETSGDPARRGSSPRLPANYE